MYTHTHIWMFGDAIYVDWIDSLSVTSKTKKHFNFSISSAVLKSSVPVLIFLWFFIASLRNIFVLFFFYIKLAKWKKMRKEAEFVKINENSTLVEVRNCWGNCPVVFPDVHCASCSDPSRPPCAIHGDRQFPQGLIPFHLH